LSQLRTDFVKGGILKHLKVEEIANQYTLSKDAKAGSSFDILHLSILHLT